MSELPTLSLKKEMTKIEIIQACQPLVQYIMTKLKFTEGYKEENVVMGDVADALGISSTSSTSLCICSLDHYSEAMSSYNVSFLINFARNWVNTTTITCCSSLPDLTSWQAFSQAVDLLESYSGQLNHLEITQKFVLGNAWWNNDNITGAVKNNLGLYSDAARIIHFVNNVITPTDRKFKIQLNIFNDEIDKSKIIKTACQIARGVSTNHSYDGQTLSNFVNSDDCTPDISSSMYWKAPSISNENYGSASTGLTIKLSNNNYIQHPQWSRITTIPSGSTTIYDVNSQNDKTHLANIYNVMTKSAIHASQFRTIAIISMILGPISMCMIAYYIYKSFC